MFSLAAYYLQHRTKLHGLIRRGDTTAEKTLHKKYPTIESIATNYGKSDVVSSFIISIKSAHHAGLRGGIKISLSKAKARIRTPFSNDPGKHGSLFC